MCAFVCVLWTHVTNIYVTHTRITYVYKYIYIHICLLLYVCNCRVLRIRAVRTSNDMTRRPTNLHTTHFRGVWHIQVT